MIRAHHHICLGILHRKSVLPRKHALPHIKELLRRPQKIKCILKLLKTAILTDLRGSSNQVHKIPEGKCQCLFDKSNSSIILVLELLICKGMVVFINTKKKRIFPRASSTGEFSDSLRSFRDCVLGKFSRQYQTHSCLNFP